MTQQLLDQYDWAILGDHPSAFWTAQILANSGLSVLVLPLISSGSAISSSSTLRFFERTSFPSFLAEDAPAELVQILTPSRRVMLYPDRELLEQELFSVYGKANRPKDLIQGLEFMVRGHDLGRFASESFDTLIKRVQGQRYFSYGKVQIAELLKDQLRRSGVHVIEDRKLQQIFVDAKGVSGVQLEGQSKTVSIKSALMCTSWEHSQGLFASEPVTLFPGRENKRALGWWFCIQFTMNSEMLPPGATSKMIYSEENGPIVEVERLSVHLRRGTQSWIARTLLPYDPQSLNRVVQRKTSQRLFRLLQSILPFLEYAVSEISPDIRDPEKVEEVELPAFYPFQKLAEIPPHLLAYGGQDLGFLTPHPQIYRAYRDAFPRFGDLGCYHACANAVMDWAKRNQKPVPEKIKEGLLS